MPDYPRDLVAEVPVELATPLPLLAVRPVLAVSPDGEIGAVVLWREEDDDA